MPRIMKGEGNWEENRETIAVEHDCVVNNDQLFALSGEDDDN